MKIISLHIALFGLLQASAQPSVSVLRVNGLEAAVNSNGLMFDSLGSPYFKSRSGLMLANRAGIWISATDSTGKILSSAHDVIGNSHAFSAGPLEVKNGQAPDPALWNKTYPISAAEITFHQNNYGKSGYIASSNILNWPGSADSPYATIMAPFVDYMVNDMIYKPMEGDYPYIKSDGLIYSIFNDKYGNPSPLGIEVHSSMYAFDEKDSVLKNCILMRYTVHNRSGKNYTNFRLSSAINFGIGTQANEFLGTHAGAQAIFAVNDTGEATFSNKLVSMGCMLINRRISSTMYFNDNTDPISGRPATDRDFYYLMQGRWKSGKQLTYFGNGVDGSIPARFVYPYTSDNSHGDTLWSEESTLNLPGQRIGLINTDSTQLMNGEAKVYDFVYFFVEKNNYNIKQVADNCLSIRTSLEAKNLLKIPISSVEKAASLSCFPNPVKSGEKLMISKGLEAPTGLRLMGVNGEEICKLDLDINGNCIILPPYLSGGVYMIEYKTLNTIQYNKLIINN